MELGPRRSAAGQRYVRGRVVRFADDSFRPTDFVVGSMHEIGSSFGTNEDAAIEVIIRWP